MTRALRTVTIALALIVAGGPFVAAQEAPIPVDVQLALFTKVWKLDRNFPARPEVTVAVLYQRTHHASAMAREAVFAWARKAPRGVQVVAIALDEVDRVDQLLATIAVDVFYVAPMRGISIPDITRIARSRGVRTITGVPVYVNQGIAVGLGVRNDRPLIIINVAAARAEGSAFQAQLLQLALLVNR